MNTAAGLTSNSILDVMWAVLQSPFHRPDTEELKRTDLGPPVSIQPCKKPTRSPTALHTVVEWARGLEPVRAHGQDVLIHRVPRDAQHKVRMVADAGGDLGQGG